ncbi:hypothetical protein KJ765_06745 [Candidatus Micrarchaeota archaeon]|nr:hypothetical protein [Candidatus Micrarchaeota archaeon]
MTDLQKQALDLRQEGTQMNQEVRKLADTNQQNIVRFRELMARANETKHQRDVLNGQVKDQVDKRRQLVAISRDVDRRLKEKEAQLQALPQESRYSASQLRRTIQQLEWQLQTESLSPRDEKALSQEINRLLKELKKVQKRDPLYQDLRTLRKERHDLSLEFRALDKTLDLARKESDEMHKKMLSIYAKSDEVKAQITDYLSIIGEKSKEADEVFAKLRSTKQELDEETQESRRTAEATRRKQESEQKLTLDEQARKIYDEFRAGRKISLEDLQILQASGIEI